MGSEIGEETETTTLKEYFDRLFEYALSIGMTPYQFWEEDVELFNRYYGAEMIRQRKRNNEIWLQGLYIYNAIGCLAPILNMGSKDHKAKPYMSKPIPITEEEIEEHQLEKEKRFVAFMDRLAKGGKKDG